MKQCPRCNRNYADETLSFCLDDGATLVKKYDPDATMINPYPAVPIVPPTVAYQRTPATQPLAPAMPVYAAEAPPGPRRRSPWAIGALVLLALALGLTIGGFIFQRSNSPSSNSSSVVPAVNPVVTNTAPPTSVPATPTPTQVLAQTTTPTSSAEQSNATLESACVIYNDKNDKSLTNVRTNCDTRNCDSDASTIVGEYPDNTPIRVIRGESVQGAHFRWVKVMITSSGQTVWVASAKIKCE